VEISAVLEGAVTRLSKRKVISGATERSSLRVTTVDDLGEGSEIICTGSEVREGSGCESEGSEGGSEVTEAKSGEFSESGGCLIANEGS